VVPVPPSATPHTNRSRPVGPAPVPGIAIVAGTGGNSLDGYARELRERLGARAIFAPGSTGSFGHRFLSSESLRRARADLAVVRRLRADRISALHFTSQHLARYGTAAGVGYVVTVHDLIRLNDWYERGRADPLIHRPNLRDALHLRADVAGIRRAAAVIAVSERTARELHARLRIPRERVHVIPEAVDTTRFVPTTPPAGYGQYVLFVGSEQPRKNLPTLIRAVAKLVRDPQNAALRLVKVGAPGGPEAPYRRRFLEEVHAAGLGDRLVLTDRVSHEELLSWYSGAQCLVLPSLAEGFGLPVLEAMACGCPTVVPDDSAQADVGGAATARYFPATDADALATVIRRLLDGSGVRDELRRRGFARARELNWERTVERTRAVYEAVLRAPAAAGSRPRSAKALQAAVPGPDQV
jgi:glycosyltransferase involved in cell wall biosynthesis